MSADILKHPTFGRSSTAGTPGSTKPPRRPRAPKVERLPCDRVRLALEASHELDALADALLGPSAVDREQERLLHRAFAIRVRDLAGVVTSVTGGDDSWQTAEMHKVVHGAKPPSG